MLVGRNASGKSTVLDALFIGAFHVPSEAVGRVVRRRRGQDGPQAGRWLLWKSGNEGETWIEVTSPAQYARCVRLKSQPPNVLQVVPEDTDLGVADLNNPHEAHLVPTSVVFGSQGVFTASPVSQPFPGATEVHLVDPGRNGAAPLHRLYSRAVEKGRKAAVREMVSALVAEVQDLEILTEEDEPVLYLVMEDHAVPAALAGDGLHTLLTLALELGIRSDGVVLLEEPEVHQHPGGLRQSARAVWAAIDRGVQVVISTHSIELIDMLLVEAPDKGFDRLSLYRLALDSTGELRSSRLGGPQIAAARLEIEDDLR